MNYFLILFFRITREVNPGITNFRNLEQQQFLLGAIGALSGKNAPKKFTIRTQLFESWIVLSTDYHTIQQKTDQENQFITLASRSRFIQWISLYRRQPPPPTRSPVQDVHISTLKHKQHTQMQWCAHFENFSADNEYKYNYKNLTTNINKPHDKVLQCGYLVVVVRSRTTLR